MTHGSKKLKTGVRAVVRASDAVGYASVVDQIAALFRTSDRQTSM